MDALLDVVVPGQPQGYQRPGVRVRGLIVDLFAGGGGAPCHRTETAALSARLALRRREARP